MGLAPGARHDDEREHLLLPRRQLGAESAHHLGGAHLHQRMRLPVFLLLRDHHHVELAVRVA